MHVIPEHVFFPLLLWSTVIYFGPHRVFENYQPTVSHNDERHHHCNKPHHRNQENYEVKTTYNTI